VVETRGTSGPALRQGFWTLFHRAWRLRCPACGNGRLFRGLFSMHEQCTACGFSCQRGPGFYLGAIYFNYGLTALLVTIAYPLLRFGTQLSRQQALIIVAAIAVLVPLWYFRYARSLWLGFDQYFDPQRQC
jgi:uncharacterized protein (DUF983 family)